jgi:phosphatidate cytidylyltransferase
MLRAPTAIARWMAPIGWIVLVGFWVALVQLHARSPWLLLAAMAVVWIADTAAYFAGRAFGRHRLAPAVSPGKTWEGVAGAVVAVALYALACAYFLPHFGLAPEPHPATLVAWLVLGMVLTAVSVIGDLYESWLKRAAGVKDSGRLLPGHGGILDRIDALLAALPLAALAAWAWLP